jgi:serine/threonine protein kinase
MMTDPQAKALFAELKEKRIAGWEVKALLGNGNSGAVFKAQRGEQLGAIKVFARDLVEDPEILNERIEREKSAGAIEHPSLAKVFDGGFDPEFGLHYLVMEYLDGGSLDKSLSLVPRDLIARIIKQVASAARGLEEAGYSHRDIKPSNIVCSADWHPKLIDYGVIRPLAGSDLTDEASNRPFLGTYRYAPPEYLLRTEDDTLEGWRAISFYQLGAVLFSLLAREPIFAKIREPRAKLILTALWEMPMLPDSAIDESPKLSMLAMKCLNKDWKERLRRVSWNDFEECDVPDEGLENAKRRIALRQECARASLQAALVPSASSEAQVLEVISRCIRDECAGDRDFPPVIVRKLEADSSVEVCFGPSGEKALEKEVRVRFRCLTATDANIEIEADGKAGGALGPLKPGTRIYQGPFHESLLRSSLHGAMVIALDAALDPGKTQIEVIDFSEVEK